MSGDRFREGQDLTRALRDELKHVREDVDAIVRREVERAGVDPARVAMIVREAVARELDARTPWALARIQWVGPAIGVAVGLALGLSAFAVFSVRSAGPARDPANVVASAPETAPILVTPPLAVSSDPAARAARYDSLIANHAPELDPLVAQVEDATVDGEVRTAIAAWRLRRTSPGQRERLHAALVQSILRAEVDSGLAIDGGILREPCRGQSCAALLELWQARGADFGLPPYTASAATDGLAVRDAERLLVLSRVDGGEG